MLLLLLSLSWGKKTLKLTQKKGNRLSKTRFLLVIFSFLDPYFGKTRSQRSSGPFEWRDYSVPAESLMFYVKVK